MSSFITVLKAMFKNKLRFGASATKGKKVGIYALFGAAYALVMFCILSVVVALGDLLGVPQFASMFYFFVLMTAALIVLIFGIVNLVSTLYLSKDTDFYSMLPVKSHVVFAAKLAYVYFAETAIVAAVMLPTVITFGIVIEAWAWYYVISLLALVIVPAMPLAVAAIFAIPVMYLAGKLKNRNLVSLIFYLVLFGAFFGVYLYFMYMSSSMGDDGVITEAQLQGYFNALNVVFYIFYPYTALTSAALGLPSFGLGVGASTAVNLLIFFGVSIALIAILLLLGRFMYSQSAKANNQTDNSRVKKGDYKYGGSVKAIMKREYISSMRTTQVAFQCYAVFILPLICAVMFAMMFRNMGANLEQAGMAIDDRFPLLLTFCTLAAMLATVGNATITTFSREGTAIGSLKCLPVGIGKILKAKILAWLVIALPVSFVSVVIANAFCFDVAYFFLSIFSIVPLTAAYVVFGALWDLAAPKLKWTDPVQAVKHNVHATIGQFIGIGAGLAVVIVLVILIGVGISMDAVSTVCWSLLYLIAAIFAVVDILLYKKAEAYYNRIEI